MICKRCGHQHDYKIVTGGLCLRCFDIEYGGVRNTEEGLYASWAKAERTALPKLPERNITKFAHVIKDSE